MRFQLFSRRVHIFPFIFRRDPCWSALFGHPRRKRKKRKNMNTPRKELEPHNYMSHFQAGGFWFQEGKRILSFFSTSPSSPWRVATTREQRDFESARTRRDDAVSSRSHVRDRCRRRRLRKSTESLAAAQRLAVHTGMRSAVAALPSRFRRLLFAVSRLALY